MRQRGGRPSARDLSSAVGFEQTLLELMGGVFFSYRDDVPDENELGSGAFYAVDRDGGSPVLGWMRVTSRRLVWVCEDDPTPQIVPTATLAVAQCVRTDQGDWLARAEMRTLFWDSDGASHSLAIAVATDSALGPALRAVGSARASTP